jgi:hypothetical protein
LALFWQLLLFLASDPRRFGLKASRDEPENRRNRSHRKIPHARSDYGVSSLGPERLAIKLQASKLPNRARTLPASGETHNSSMVQLAAVHAVFSGKILDL